MFIEINVFKLHYCVKMLNSMLKKKILMVYVHVMNRAGRKYRPTGQWPVKIVPGLQISKSTGQIFGKIWADCETEKTLIGWNMAAVLSLATYIVLIMANVYY